MRADFDSKFRTVESKLTQQMREKVSISGEQLSSEFEQRLTEIQSRLSEQLKSKINSQTSQLVTPEFLSERML